MKISVIVCTHNPDRNRLNSTLSGLRLQQLPSDQWEILLIDNASAIPVQQALTNPYAITNLRIIAEPELGLTNARRCGIANACGEIVIFVDDDNVLKPDYLEQVLAAFSRLPRVGALGGKSIGQFEETPHPSLSEFLPLLAVRDLGETEQISKGLRPPSSSYNIYPPFAPIGAGMALRREAIRPWLQRKSTLSDRRGNELTSSGDNDIVISIMEAGWEVAYIPSLQLNHLIPVGRLSPVYLARLNRGIQKSWTQMLLAHNACTWPQISSWTVPLRQLKAWFTYRAWSTPVARIRWEGACGHFEGRVKRKGVHQ